MRGTFVALMLLVSAGCAFNDVPLAMPISGLEHPIEGGSGRQIVVVKPFSDSRPSSASAWLFANLPP